MVSSLVIAARDLLEACYQADAKEELSAEIDGSLLDAVRDALIEAIPEHDREPAREWLSLGYPFNEEGIASLAALLSSVRAEAALEHPRRPNIAELEEIIAKHPRLYDVWIAPNGITLDHVYEYGCSCESCRKVAALTEATKEHS
jgi:hypothetical protein